MKDNLLDLSTIHQRPTITIDGTRYGLKTWDDFGLLDVTYFQEVGKKALGMGNTITDEEVPEVAEMINGMIDKIVVDLPASVRDKLTDWQKIKIIEVFSEAVTPQEGSGEAATQENPSTGENSSPDSKTDMEETPSAG